jgi:hypothetical protein
MRNLLKIFFLIIWAAGLALSSSGAVQGQTLDKTQWQKLETKYTIVKYQSLKDLKKFNRKVDYSPGKWSLQRLFSNSDSNNLADDLSRKVDALYERVQEILDMRRQTKKVCVNIYSDKSQLVIAYKKVSNSTFSAYSTLSQPRAWYLYERNTIYVNVNDLREGILAHEMAHSIIDHYLSVRPPRTSAEILARYVDSHLY